MKNIITVLLFVNSCCIYSDSLSVLFLGDTHFGENYIFDPKFSHGTNFIIEKGYDYFFENVRHILTGSEAVICNLETPLTNDTNSINSRKPYLHYSSPDSTLKYFKKYNITVPLEIE